MALVSVKSPSDDSDLRSICFCLSRDINRNVQKRKPAERLSDFIAEKGKINVNYVIDVSIHIYVETLWLMTQRM